ncbi:LacI family DNA-binding transcriptional regulator [Bacillus solitudinis]|uniref:LacI family DNA-binding transcriptional regulator n=1 Tax=Bacillus solitudinis TaxID=2014074 RepID=UPI000C24A3B1|nr:LacI family DNA-binding transcriptional regulator [Bacillus solitudinis]
MKITAKMIAEQLGISPATVDRALNKRNGVSPKTLRRVLEKAKELDYKPNQAASFLSRKKQILVAFVFPIYPEYFWEEIEVGIQRTVADLRHYGFEIEIIRTFKYDTSMQLEIVKEIIQSKKYDGLVFSANDASPFVQIINEGIEKGFPIYTINNDSPSSKRLFYVGADYLDSGRLAGELLYSFTHLKKRFAVITDIMNTFQMQQKVLGFKEYMGQRKDVEMIEPLKIDSNNLEQSLKTIQKEMIQVDGIYVASGNLAEVSHVIERIDINQRPRVIGHDMNESIYELLQKEVITASICQDPIYQGSLTVRKVFNHLMLEEAIDTIEDIVKLEIVTKGNVKYYFQH